ncbi:hypothetical protein [Streptomyces sp. SP2-10]|uniref:hypothetical protein n=1 Tax=Streptomyces sp. SP2-10 TaxID=2873385 RepID=UPI00223C489C|nr:hypothetical protein [Streptomyces sp. SP2-10]
MTPIPARSGTAPGHEPGVRRGRHRKPRPRRVLLAAGGLALAAGVLSLVRVAPESGVGAPGTAEAEPRHGPGGAPTDGSANHAATIAAAPTALPSATSALGGRSPAPTSPGSPAPGTAGTATVMAPPGGTAVPTTAPTAVPTGVPGSPGTPAGTPRPTSTASAPRPAPASPTPAPAPSRTPAPDHGTAKPDPGGVCVPVIGLCVDVLGDANDQHRLPRRH